MKNSVQAFGIINYRLEWFRGFRTGLVVGCQQFELVIFKDHFMLNKMDLQSIYYQRLTNRSTFSTIQLYLFTV